MCSVSLFSSVSLLSVEACFDTQTIKTVECGWERVEMLNSENFLDSKSIFTS